MSTTRVRVDSGNPQSLPEGAIIQCWTALPRAILRFSNNRTAPKPCGTWSVSPVGCAGRRLGLTQVEFPRRIDVPDETIRNWEGGQTQSYRRRQGFVEGS